MIENIKLKHKIVSLSLNIIITRNMVWVVRNGDELVQNLNTLPSGGLTGTSAVMRGLSHEAGAPLPQMKRCHSSSKAVPGNPGA